MPGPATSMPAPGRLPPASAAASGERGGAALPSRHRPYTAGAIAAIAFGGRHAAVDGNVERVISRFYSIETPLPELEALDPREGAGAGAGAPCGRLRPGDDGSRRTICTPRDPNCLICPWAEACEGRISGLAPSLPRKQPKKQVPIRRGTAFWIERADGAVLLRRRPEKGLLGGMMEVPSTAWGEPPSAPEAQAPLAARWRSFGHGRAHVHHFHSNSPSGAPRRSALANCVTTGIPLDAAQGLERRGLPTLMRKVVAHVLKDDRG